MAITLKNIAKETGVSETVVSHVLNKRKSTVRVSEAKRAMIVQTAKQMGYVPNMRARAMATGKSCSIALIHTDPHEESNPLAHAYMFQVLRAVEDVCRAVDYHCLYSTLRTRHDEAISLPRVVLDGSVDGIILMDHTRDEDARQIASLGIPCVHFGTNITPEVQMDCIYCDLDKAFADSVAYLHKLGHRHIQMLFPAGHGPELHARGFKALEALYPGLHAEVKLLDNAYARRREALEYTTNELVQRDDRPTAYLAPNEIWQGLVDGLGQRGWFCPQDYSLVAMTNTLGVEEHWLRVQPGNIRVSHVVNPVDKVATQTARLLLAKLGKKTLTPEQANLRAIPCELVIADSCAPPPGGQRYAAPEGRPRQRYASV